MNVTMALALLSMTAFIFGFMTFMVVYTIVRRVNRYLTHRWYVIEMKKLNNRR